MFCFFNTFDFLFRVTDNEEFGFGFSGFVPAQNNTRVVGQILLYGCRQCYPRPRHQVGSGLRRQRGVAFRGGRARGRQAGLLGVDDHALFGAPGWMVVGDAAALREPDGIIIDDRGFAALFPGQPLRVGDEIELSDRRAKIVGICRVSPPFATFPVIYAKISDARRFVGRERNFINFVVANPDEGVSADELSERIAERTGLKAMPASAFAWRTVLFYIANTGIPVNFGITICVAVIVGVVITGQTFLVFVFENIKVFAGLKAMGTTQRTLSAMIVLQALTVGVLGLGIGLGACAVFFDATAEIPHLRNFRLYPQILAGTSAVMLTISVLASIAALVRVGKVEPATVFRA